MTGARVLVTGGNGFVGRHLIAEILKRSDWTVLNLQRLPQNLVVPNPRILNFYHDFRAPLQDSLIADLGKVDIIIHNGAEVHAIRSLTDPRSFVQSNCIGVFNLLEAARKLNVKRFVYTSSAEVFGPAIAGQYHNEDAALNPSNPYSAAKAGGEMLCRSYFKSFRVPVNIVRSMNMFGEKQDETKFVPLVVKKAMAGENLKVHKRGEQIGSRQWIYIENYVGALLHILQNGTPGEAYNIAGLEQNNLQIVDSVDQYLRSKTKIELIEAPHTHDMRYAISDEKLRDKMGWSNPVWYEEGFKRTVESLKGDYDTASA